MNPRRDGPAERDRQGPSPVVALLRGIAGRCPRCGSGGLFRRWFRLEQRCPRCGLLLEREEGAFLGSISISYGVTAVLFMALLVAWLIIDSPDVRFLPLAVAAAVLVVVVPFLFYPYAKTIWAAIDFLLEMSDPAPRGGRSQAR